MINNLGYRNPIGKSENGVISPRTLFLFLLRENTIAVVSGSRV